MGWQRIRLGRAAEPGIAEGAVGGWSVLRTYDARDILIVPTDSIGKATPRPLVTGPANETDVVISPSAKLVAYQSDEGVVGKCTCDRYQVRDLA